MNAIKDLIAKAEKFLHTAESALGLGDYEARAAVSQDQARALLETSHGFVQKVEEYLGEWMDEGQGI